MSTVTTPGVRSSYQIISRECRDEHGDEGAIDEALRRVRDAFLKTAMYQANNEAKFHVVLTVERPGE